MWPTYQKDKMTESKVIIESIHAFEHRRKELEAKESEDLSDEQIDNIYTEICQEARSKREGYILK
jgi:hypothetical protein